MAKILVDASGAIYGRLCSFVAKQALEGNEVAVVNSEKAVMTGRKEATIQKYHELSVKGGSAQKGPHYSKTTYRMLKRGIRGMLPDYRSGIGKQALLRVKCYDGVPKEFEGQKMIKSGKPKHEKYITLKELASKI